MLQQLLLPPLNLLPSQEVLLSKSVLHTNHSRKGLAYKSKDSLKISLLNVTNFKLLIQSAAKSHLSTAHSGYKITLADGLVLLNNRGCSRLWCYLIETSCSMLWSQATSTQRTLAGHSVLSTWGGSDHLMLTSGKLPSCDWSAWLGSLTSMDWIIKNKKTPTGWRGLLVLSIFILTGWLGLFSSRVIDFDANSACTETHMLTHTRGKGQLLPLQGPTQTWINNCMCVCVCVPVHVYVCMVLFCHCVSSEWCNYWNVLTIKG